MIETALAYFGAAVLGVSLAIAVSPLIREPYELTLSPMPGKLFNIHLAPKASTSS